MASVVFWSFDADIVHLTSPYLLAATGSGDDTVTIAPNCPVTFLSLGGGNDMLVAEGPLGVVLGGAGDDEFVLKDHSDSLRAGRGNDTIHVEGSVRLVRAGSGNDKMTSDGLVGTMLGGQDQDLIEVDGIAGRVHAGAGHDEIIVRGRVNTVQAGRGDDIIRIEGDAAHVRAGAGDDMLKVGNLVSAAYGGIGADTLVFNMRSGEIDVDVLETGFRASDRFSGETMTFQGFETLVFLDRTFSSEEFAETFSPRDGAPVIQVGGGTQTLTVNNSTPTVSVLWDRVVQQAVIDTETPTGPTVASRAYAMMHTAMYDAWSAFDPVAVPVSFDFEGDNVEIQGTDAAKAEAMSWAAWRILTDLFPDMAPLYRTVMEKRLGLELNAQSEFGWIGIDAAEDLLALRHVDGANQKGGYADTSLYNSVNSGPNDIVDITRWTPENVPIDPEDDVVEQSFLTPHWFKVQGFGLSEDANGTTDFAPTLPTAPRPFFTETFAGSNLDVAQQAITISSELKLDGEFFAPGDILPVSRDLIGPVINPDFISQADEIVAYSAGLTDKHKIIAEFWEDGKGTSFPPGTWMSIGQFVSARDSHDIDADAKMFLALGNAVMDAGIATWQSKVEYDYTRPVRAIRELGALGLIGEEGRDELTGETGYVIEAFGGFDENGYGLGTRTILAENFTTFQRPFGDTSPPFAEYTSGHSGFSAAAAEVLAQVTGSDAFGGHVRFNAGTIQFEEGVPHEDLTLAWDTFSEAADEAGLSRLYGNIHFSDGDMNGRELGRKAGASAFETAELFISGMATDVDRPFYGDDLPFV